MTNTYTLHDRRFNSGTDYRSFYDSFYESARDRFFDSYYLKEQLKDIIITNTNLDKNTTPSDDYDNLMLAYENQTTHKTIEEFIDYLVDYNSDAKNNKKHPYRSVIDTIVYDTVEAGWDGPMMYTELEDEFGIQVKFYQNNVSAGTYGTLAQLDGFDTDIIITDIDKFKSQFNEFVEWCRTKPKYRYGVSNFNTYATYKGVEFIYDIENFRTDIMNGDVHGDNELLNVFIEWLGKYNLEHDDNELLIQLEDKIVVSNYEYVISAIIKEMTRMEEIKTLKNK